MEKKAELLELLNCGSYMTSIRKVGAFRFPSNYRFQCHRHEEIEINYVAAGCCMMGVGDEFVSLKKGDCIIIYRHTPHSFMVNLKQSCRLIQLEMKITLPVKPYENLFIQELQSGRSYRKCSNSEMVADYIEMIGKQKNKEEFNETGRLLVELQIAGLYVILAKKIQEENQLTPKRKDKFNQIVEHINQNFTDSIDMEQLSREFNLSSRYIRKRFISDIGMNSSQYINTLRVNKAKELLWDFNLNITDIANLTGFGNSQYFCRVFKSFTAMTPAGYRKLWSENKERQDYLRNTSQENLMSASESQQEGG